MENIKIKQNNYYIISYNNSKLIEKIKIVEKTEKTILIKYVDRKHGVLEERLLIAFVENNFKILEEIKQVTDIQKGYLDILLP